MSWSDDKELSLRADAIGWNSKKKKKPYTKDSEISGDKRVVWSVLDLCEMEDNDWFVWSAMGDGTIWVFSLKDKWT